MISAETLAELEARRLLYILGVRERTDKMVRELGRSRLAPAGRRDASLDLIRSEITRWRYKPGGGLHFRVVGKLHSQSDAHSSELVLSQKRRGVENQVSRLFGRRAPVGILEFCRGH